MGYELKMWEKRDSEEGKERGNSGRKDREFAVTV